MRTVLFLCSGNYYRSRFAEELFNALVKPAGLDWRADSAGLAVGAGAGNIGPISPDTVRELARRGILVRLPPRYARHVEAAGLARADRVIALNESEHRPLLVNQFPEWSERAEYWHIPDLDQVPAPEGLAAVGHNVETLIQELRRLA